MATTAATETKSVRGLGIVNSFSGQEAECRRASVDPNMAEVWHFRDLEDRNVQESPEYNQIVDIN